MSKTENYKQTLQSLDDWVPFLKKNSGLPGPRGNLELAHAVAEQGDQKQFEYFLSLDAKENTPEVFVVFCGVVGLGKLSAKEPQLFNQVRESHHLWKPMTKRKMSLSKFYDREWDIVGVLRLPRCLMWVNL